MLICRNCGNSGRDMFGNVCPCQKPRMKGRAMYAVFYRLGGYEEMWRESPCGKFAQAIAAGMAANAVEKTLRHVGYKYAQAEARPVDAPAVTETAVTQNRCAHCHQFLRSDEQWQIVEGGMFAHRFDCFAEPVVEVGPGETPPADYGKCPDCGWWNAHAYDCHAGQLLS